MLSLMKGGTFMKIKNPLRYPGAKSKLVDYIEKLIINQGLQGCTIYEPYAGSSTITFNLLERNVVANAVINELDPLIYNFWYSVMYHTDELIELIEKTPITLDTWYELAKYKKHDYLKNKTALEIGFAGLFLNRTNFSGILNASMLGGVQQTSKYKIDCRFNKKSIIESIINLSRYRNRIILYNMDAIDFLKRATHYKRTRKMFVYIDPPYFEKGPLLYRYYYNYDMHLALAKYIKTKTFPWLVSYDNTEEIRKMYRRRNQQQIYLDYSISTTKKGNELLISNLEIPPLENLQSIADIEQLG